MKNIKISLVILVVLSTNSIKAQVPDTAKYLIDSIQPKISYYVGKPLKVLLNDLKIKPVDFVGVLPTPNKPDTIQFKLTWLDFFLTSERDKRADLSLKSANIRIEFAQPIAIPKIWFWYNGRFEKRTWDRVKRHFFENFIIGSMRIEGI